MPSTERMAPTASMPRGARVRHVADDPDAGQDDGDDHRLEQERDPPRQVRGDEPAEQRAHRSSDRGRRTDQGVDLLLGRTLEVAVDERLHRRQQERGTQPAADRPEDDDRA